MEKQPMIEVKRANEKLINTLLVMGVLYTDENGIHAGNEGIYGMTVSYTQGE